MKLKKPWDMTLKGDSENWRIGVLRLVFTSDGVRVGVVVGVIRELIT